MVSPSGESLSREAISSPNSTCAPLGVNYKKEELMRKKKETDSLGVKDQSTCRLFIVVSQVNVHGTPVLFIGWYGLSLPVEV
jgi:hypothetical protein